MWRSYTPTLGGLMTGTRFLADLGLCFPILELNIFGRIVRMPLTLAVTMYGRDHKAVDVRLKSKNDDRFIQFLHIEGRGPDVFARTIARGYGVIIESGPPDSDFASFIYTEEGRKFSRLCVWGKPELSFADRLILNLAPVRYARRHFPNLSELRLNES